MLEQLLTVRAKVGYLLDTFPPLRDNDKLLWLAYLNQFHGLRAKLGDESYNVLKAIIISSETPSTESIRRVRQQFQEEGNYLGEKREKRLEEEKRVRKWAKKK